MQVGYQNFISRQFQKWRIKIKTEIDEINKQIKVSTYVRGIYEEDLKTLPFPNSLQLTRPLSAIF